jgi:hypothetical protein
MWLKILDNYEISDEGVIRNINTGRIIKQFIGKDGYLRTQIAGKTRTVHRLVAMAFIPPEEGKLFVNHKDGNKQNNKSTNLEWCTRSENMKHAYDHRLREPPVGIKNGRNKLSYEDVSFILEHYKPRDSVFGAKALATVFNVAPQTISAVISGQNWRVLSDYCS